MRIVEPSVEVFFHVPILPREEGEKKIRRNKVHLPPGSVAMIGPEEFLEQVGRTCYKSEDRITSDSAGKFVRMLHERGHHAMLEHCVASCKFVCDRGMTHELVRHRLVSYAQESTRYCNYGKDKFGGEVSFIKPPGLTDSQEGFWVQACQAAENCYLAMTKIECPPQIARSVLPICLKTEIWATTNLREWTHIFGLRCAPAAHPQIRELMIKALKVFKEEVPAMFAPLWEKFGPKEKEEEST